MAYHLKSVLQNKHKRIEYRKFLNVIDQIDNKILFPVKCDRPGFVLD